MHAYALGSGRFLDFDALPADATLFVRDDLPAADVRRLGEHLVSRPDATLRLCGAAIHLLERLPEALPRNIALDSDVAPRDSQTFERVDSVEITGSGNVATWLQRFPNTRAVRVVLHGERVDAAAVASPQLQSLSLAEGTVFNAAALRRATSLTTLELRDVALDAFGPVAQLAAVQSLRLSAVERLSSIAELRGHPGVRALWLQRLPFLDDLDVLKTLPALESIELSKLWQFEMHHAGVLFEMPALRRASIDIGGRRKNVEIEKRLQLAPAYAFDAKRPVLPLVLDDVEGMRRAERPGVFVIGDDQRGVGRVPGGERRRV
jgi:hypothetical protein